MWPSSWRSQQQGREVEFPGSVEPRPPSPPRPGEQQPYAAAHPEEDFEPLPEDSQELLGRVSELSPPQQRSCLLLEGTASEPAPLAREEALPAPRAAPVVVHRPKAPAPAPEMRGPPPEQGEERALRATLAQTESALMRQQGENYLLGAMAQQLEQRAEEMGRDAQLCVAQLAQAMQLLESASLRTTMKGEVDRARALVASARRGMLRVASLGAGKDRGGNSGSTAAAADQGSGGRPAAGRGTNRRSEPRPRPLSPRAKAQQRPGDQTLGGLAASAAAAVHESSAPVLPSAGCTGATTPGCPQQRRPASGRAGEEGSAPAKGGARPSSKAGGEKEQRRRPGGQLSPPRGQPAAGRQPASGSKSTSVPPPEQEDATCTQNSASASAQAETVASETLLTPGIPQPPPQSVLPELQEQFLRQRLLLTQALRKAASLQEEVSTAKDDVTRRDVIIHGLRQELAAHRQELEVQQSQFEQQQAALQQQHQLQQLQQLQQVQELHRLLQQSQVQRVQQREGDAAPPPPLLPPSAPQQVAPPDPRCKEAALQVAPQSWEEVPCVPVPAPAGLYGNGSLESH